VKEAMFLIKQHQIKTQKEMKALSKAVVLHKIQLSKKKVKLNKKKQILKIIHLIKKEKIQYKLIKERIKKFKIFQLMKTH
jgi:hypothetical protein